MKYPRPTPPEACFSPHWRAYTAALIHWAWLESILGEGDTPPPRQLERHAYPGQPATHAAHVIKPCCCQYIRWTSHTNPTDPTMVIATGFHICPVCPHHGHLAHAEALERLWSDPYLNGLLRDPYDLDDGERRS